METAKDGTRARLVFALVVAVIVVTAGVVAASYHSASTTNSSTSTAAVNSTQEVMGAFAAHLQSIESHNVTALVAQYESNATLNLVCSPNGFIGVYTGTYNINILYHVMFNSTVAGTMNFTDFSPGILASVSGEIIVNSTFNAQGSESASSITAFSGGANFTQPWTKSVRLGDSYVDVGNAWLISSEIWTFGDINTVYNTCG